MPKLLRAVRLDDSDDHIFRGCGAAKDGEPVVSGGFAVAKIASFEEQRAPVDAYAVGSAFLRDSGAYDFTADIVAVRHANGWAEQHKIGRPERPNPRLEPVD